MFSTLFLCCALVVGVTGQQIRSIANNAGFPQFDSKLISETECNSLPRNRCWFNDETCLYGGISRQITRGVKETVAYFECQESASAQEFLDTATKLSTTNPKRAVELFLRGTITNQTFENLVNPIKKQVIELTFSDFNGNHKRVATQKIGALPLPYLLHLKFQHCSELVIKKNDFATFTYLRRLEFYQTFSMMSIERDSFMNLPQLLTFELETGHEGLFGYGTIFKKESELCDPARPSTSFPIHCDCQYLWLRNWLKAKPYLQIARAEGNLYIVGNHPSKEVKKQLFILAAIGCS